MRNVLTIFAATALAILSGCGNSSDDPLESTLTADEAAQLNDAAEMLDTSSTSAPLANSAVP